MKTLKHDVFISYRRDGGEYTAKILRDRLDELGYSVFFDVESLRSGDFNTKLYSVIEECGDFVLILSPGALDRCQNEDDWVRREVEYALERGKNIVPVMLRGFEFPETLPLSIEPLHYKNGIQANTEFFEAFIQKLQKFLSAKPPLWRRVTQNTLFRRTLPAFLALLLAAAVGVGVYTFLNRSAAVYPRTAAEKDLVKETVYYVEMNLTRMDQAADSRYRALEETRRYITSGSVSRSALSGQLDNSETLITGQLSQLAPPSDQLLEQLRGSPFDAVEFTAMYDVLTLTANSWLDDIAYFRWVAGPDCYYSNSEKLRVLDCYRSIWEEDMRALGYAVNESLLPVTDQSALSEFLYDHLPTLTHISLNASSWSQDQKVLESLQDECWNKQQAALQELSSILGDQTAATALLRESLILQYMELGMTRAEAEAHVEEQLALDDGVSEEDKLKWLRLRKQLIQQYVDMGVTQAEAEEAVDGQVLPLLAEALETLAPQEGDGEDTLWVKLRGHMALRLYDWAPSCVDALEALGEEQINAYLPALRAFVDSADLGQIDYGVMVTAYYEPDGINEVLRIGDVIVELNGAPCRSYEEYVAQKEALSSPGYTVGVLRLNGSGGLDRLTLELTLDMPRVVLNSLNDKDLT